MTERKADHPIMPLLLERWSPRAFDPRPMDDATLMSLFEAARWAPSSGNLQPWRFVYAKRDDAHWEAFFSALDPGNQIWVQNASVLIYILSDSKMDPRGTGQRVPAYTHSFDAGSAWMSLALQATSMGLYTHGMAGVDFALAHKLIGAPDDYRVEAAIAVGYIGDRSLLPERLQEREIKSGRRPLSETVFHGPMPG